MQEQKFWVYDGRRRVPKSVTTVMIPDGVREIRNSAFEYCRNLVSISIPDSVVKIGEWAFHRCLSLPSIQLPSSITKIKEGAFADCESLKSIIFHPSSKIEHIGEMAFVGCKSLISIKFPSTNKYKIIGHKAFKDCSSMTSIELPSSIQYIGEKIFKRCDSIESIFIPSASTTQIHSNVIKLVKDIIILNHRVVQTPCTTDLTLPLHLLLMFGHVRYNTDGIEKLIQAAPNQLTECDNVYNLYPFLLAACTPLEKNFDIQKSLSDEIQHLETIYMILRETPWLIDVLIKRQIKLENNQSDVQK